MPPKIKYSREAILEVGFELVKKEGIAALTARNLAAALNTSTAPIFTAFKNMDEVIFEVTEKAKMLYKEYILKALKAPLPFKECGLKYIQFANEEPMLFKLLFMTGQKDIEITHYFPADETADSVLNSAKNTYNMDEVKAKRLYNHLSVYAHGLAVMFAEGQSVFTMEDVSNMLSEIFISIKTKLESEEN